MMKKRFILVGLAVVLLTALPAQATFYQITDYIQNDTFDYAVPTTWDFGDSGVNAARWVNNETWSWSSIWNNVYYQYWNAQNVSDTNTMHVGFWNSNDAAYLFQSTTLTLNDGDTIALSFKLRKDANNPLPAGFEFYVSDIEAGGSGN